MANSELTRAIQAFKNVRVIGRAGMCRALEVVFKRSEDLTSNYVVTG